MKPLVAFAVLAATALPAAAQIITNTYSVARDAVVEKETWLNAETLSVLGTVTKDLFFQARNTEIEGELKEDVWGVSERMTFAGHARDDMRLYANRSLRMNGRVDGDLYAFSIHPQNLLHLSTNSVIGGDVRLQGSEVVVEGEVHGDLKITAAKMTLKAVVHGDVDIDSDNIAILPDTVIDGGLSTRSAGAFQVDSKVTVNGEVRHDIVSRSRTGKVLFWHSRFYVWALLAGLPLCFWFPLFTEQCIARVKTNRFRCFWMGMGLSFLVGFTGVMLAASQVGFALAVVSVGFLAILLYLSKVVIALAIGSWMLRNLPGTSPLNKLLALSLGLFIFYTLTAIPQIGPAIWMVIAFTGLGGMIQTIFESQFRKPGPPRPPEAPGAEEPA